MDVWDVLRSFRRRWTIGVPLLVVSVVVALMLGATVAKEYTVSSSVLLVVPAPSNVDPADPTVVTDEPLAFRSFNSTMQAIAEASTQYLASESVRGKLADESLPADYFVEQQTAGPVIYIEVVSDDATKSTQAVERLIDELELDLETRQELFADAPNPKIVTQLLAPPDRVAVSSGSRLRVTVLVGAVLAIMTFIMVAVVDAVASKRRRTENDAEADTDADADGEVDAETDAKSDAAAATGKEELPPPPPARVGSGARRPGR